MVLANHCILIKLVFDFSRWMGVRILLYYLTFFLALFGQARARAPRHEELVSAASA